MTRRYLYLECDDPRRLDELPGCHYVADPHRGHGAELWLDGATDADYPHKMALVTSLPGGLLQVVPLDAGSGERLNKLLTDGAGKGLVVHASAKALEQTRPELAAAVCYEQRAVAGGTEKKPGAPLCVAMALAGDDPAACADPKAIEVR